MPQADLRSTTKLTISGDIDQPFSIRRQYRREHRARNAAENVQPFDVELSWPPSSNRLAEMLGRLESIGSPSRMLCDLFWLDLDWRAIERRLGPLVVHDLGGGSGRYVRRLRAAAAPVKLRIHVFDVASHPAWASLADQDTTFRTFDGRDFAATLSDGPNLLISQSTLEHVREDLAYFDAVAAYAAGGRKLLQIHMLPGATGLPQYDLHGWRHYTRDNFRAIAATLPEGSRMSVIGLGDLRHVALHCKYFPNGRIKLPSPDKGFRRAAYMRAFETLLSDPAPATVADAAFLCLVIESNLGAPLATSLTRSQQAAL